ncbi:hypothetical protein PTKIN_Ptkin05aG0063800 [Pterospermum kingtungense]
MLLVVSSSAYPFKKKQYKPCKNLVLYFHDIIYNGHNKENATSAIVAAPERVNLTILAGQFHFENIAAFDDSITLDNNLHSKPVGRAHKTRDISVVGGTGDFFMHRGVATLITDSFEGEVY